MREMTLPSCGELDMSMHKEPIQRFQNTVDSDDPVENLQSMLEKKVRNLEKRMQKADQLKGLLETGQVLNDDQKESAIRLKEIESIIEWVRELIPSVKQIKINVNGRGKNQQKEAVPVNVFVPPKDNIKSVFEIQNNLKRLSEHSEELIKANSTQEGILTPTDIEILLKFYDRVKTSEKSSSSNQIKKISSLYQKLLNREAVAVHPTNFMTYDDLYMLCLKIIPSIESLKPAKVDQMIETEPVLAINEVELTETEPISQVVVNGNPEGEWISVKKRVRNKKKSTKVHNSVSIDQTAPKANMVQPITDNRHNYGRKSNLNGSYDKRYISSSAKAVTVKTSLADQEKIMNNLKIHSRVVIKDIAVGQSHSPPNRKSSNVKITEIQNLLNEDYDLMD